MPTAHSDVLIRGARKFARAKAFMEAFNTQNAEKVAAFFTTQAELVERNGDVVRGRKQIQAAFAEIYKGTPQNRISLDVDAVRFVARGVAIEEGRLTSFPDGKTASPTRNSPAGMKSRRSSDQKGWATVVPIGCGSPAMATSRTSADSWTKVPVTVSPKQSLKQQKANGRPV